MNNTQKSFKSKAKCGLRMAAGGMIDPTMVDLQAIKAGTVDPNGSDYDTINAEKTLRWASEDAAAAQKYGRPFTPSMAATDLVKGLSTLPAQSPAPAPSAETTFEQDIEARDQRIRGYGKALGRNYADGGVVQRETADELMARMSAKYGAPSAGKAAPPAPQAPQPPAPAQAAPTQPLGLRGIATGGLDRRMRAAGLAEGGIVRGKGGPTDDAVPMRVGGVDVNLSNTEAVLPAKTVRALGGPEEVEALIERTNGKPPVKAGLRAGGNYEGGSVYTVDRHGNVVNPNAPRPALPNPNAGAVPPAEPPSLRQTPMQAARSVGELSPEAKAYQASQAAPKAAGGATPAASRLGGLARGLGAAAMAVPVINALRSDAPTLGGKLAEGFSGQAPLSKTQSADAQYTRDNVELPWWAGPNGAMVPNAKLAEVGAAQRAKDTGQVNRVGDKETVTIDKAAGRRSTQNALANAEAGADTRRLGAAETARLNGLDYANLEPAVNGGRADFMGEKDATAYQLPEGSKGGFITRAADKGGLRQTTYLSGEASAADKQRDAEFAVKGYGKDAYGNWMTPQRLGDKQALETMERSRARFDAFDPSITDPNARAAGLRRVTYDMAYDKQAAEAAAKKADRDLTIRGQDITMRGQDNMQSNSQRDFAQKQGEAHYKRLDDLLKAKATGPEGKLDGQKYAKLQQYAGNFKSDAKEGSEAYFKDLMANLELDELFMADDGGWFRSVRNQGTDPVRGLRQQDGPLWGKYLVDPATNRRVSQSDLAKMSPSARDTLLSRIQAQQ